VLGVLPKDCRCSNAPVSLRNVNTSGENIPNNPAQRPLQLIDRRVRRSPLHSAHHPEKRLHSSMRRVPHVWTARVQGSSSHVGATATATTHTTYPPQLVAKIYNPVFFFFEETWCQDPSSCVTSASRGRLRRIGRSGPFRNISPGVILLRCNACRCRPCLYLHACGAAPPAHGPNKNKMTC